MDTILLNNNSPMPSLGLGTYQLPPLEARSSVSFALTHGYSLIDTAGIYGNERSVGKGIKDSGIPRDKVFLSSKLWPSEYENPHAVEECLSRLDVDYLDLLFLHQPAGNWKNAYRMLEDAYKKGLIHSIGVSNFEGEVYQELLDHAHILPSVMQVECNPFYPQNEFHEELKKKGIVLMSWFPLGGRRNHASLLEHPLILSLGEAHHKSPAQILLRWHLQKGYAVIPGSKNPEHILANLDVFDFSLSEEEMKEIATLETGERQFHYTKEVLDGYPKRIPNYEID